MRKQKVTKTASKSECKVFKNKGYKDRRVPGLVIMVELLSEIWRSIT